MNTKIKRETRRDIDVTSEERGVGRQRGSILKAYLEEGFETKIQNTGLILF